MATFSGYFKTRYAQEKVIVETGADRFWFAVLWGCLIALPYLAGEYSMFLVNQVLVNTIAVMGLNILTGFTGQVSLGNAAFLAIGAFVAGGLVVQGGLPFWLAVPLAGLAVMGLGLMIGLPSLRLKGLYLVLATLALHFIAQYALIRYQIPNFGPTGLKLPRVVLFGVKLRTDQHFYWVLMPVTYLVTWFTINLLRTRMGRAYVAVRDNEIAASCIGVNLAHAKLSAFAVSSFFVGVAGALNAFYVGHITVEQFSLTLAIDHVAMMIVGGMGSVVGSILGTAFMTLLPYVVPAVAKLLQSALPFLSGWVQAHLFEVRAGLSGLVVILVLLLKPEGLNGLWNDIRTYFREWPYRY